MGQFVLNGTSVMSGRLAIEAFRLELIYTHTFQRDSVLSITVPQIDRPCNRLFVSDAGFPP